MNITLLIGIILLILGLRFGFKTGFVKGIANLAALIATVATLALIIMLTSSFRAGETKNTIFTLIIMAILGAVYGIVRFMLRGMKAMSNLPIIRFVDSLLGAIVGMVWFFIVYLVLLALGIKGMLGLVSEHIIGDVLSSEILTTICKNSFLI